MTEDLLSKRTNYNLVNNVWRFASGDIGT